MIGGDLSHLEEFAGPVPTRSIWAALIREIIKRRPILVPGGGAGRGELDHPWKVTVQRWEDEAAEKSPLPKGRRWRIDVIPGLINEKPAHITYRQKDDPRGWTYQKYAFDSLRGDSVDRSLFNLADLPFLVVEGPKSGQPTDDLKNFSIVSDAARPDFFRTEDMWEKTIYRATVAVSGVRPPSPDVLLDMPPDILVPTLIGLLSSLATRATLASIGTVDLSTIQQLRPPYQIRAGRITALPNSEMRAIATLWLTREKDGDPEQDEIYVQQREFYDLSAYSMLLGAELLELIPLLQATGDIGNLVALDIFEQIFQAATIQWWSR